MIVWLNGRALDYESGGCGFKSRYGRFLRDYFFIMTKIKCPYYADVLTPQTEKQLDESINKIREDFQEVGVDQFKIISRIGRGKFSQVFLGRDKDGQQFVLKTIPNCPDEFVAKEAQILSHLGVHRGVQEFIGAVKNPLKSVYTLVLRFYPESNLEQLIPGLTQSSLKLYMKQLLESLDYVHSKGVIHRDVKPQNFLWNSETKRGVLIDFGQSVFYRPQEERSVVAGCRFFRAPELLLGYSHYHYGVDIWAAGIILASFMFQHFPLVKGSNNPEILLNLIEIFGSDELLKLSLKYNIGIPDEFQNLHFKRIPLEQSFLGERNQHLYSPEAIDLLTKMLSFDLQT